ncbi:MAG: cobyric acid synthase CobQ, partial [Zavarzinia sp.]|nr:cobyric acid synthase CobQ [Zavarzinia sp.]
SVSLTMARPGAPLPPADLVVLPGSKATIADLALLRREGWDIDIAAHVRRGGLVLGLCGGYQMLGRRIEDPQGIEGPAGGVDGLGLLDITTALTGEKRLVSVTGVSAEDGTPFHGYEMHMGRTEGPDCARPLVTLEDGRTDGAVRPDGRVRGTYVHGFFAHDVQRGAWLRRLGVAAAPLDHAALIEATLNALADHLEAHVDVGRLIALAS